MNQSSINRLRRAVITMTLAFFWAFVGVAQTTFFRVTYEDYTSAVDNYATFGLMPFIVVNLDEGVAPSAAELYQISNTSYSLPTLKNGPEWFVASEEDMSKILNFFPYYFNGEYDLGLVGINTARWAIINSDGYIIHDTYKDKYKTFGISITENGYCNIMRLEEEYYGQIYNFDSENEGFKFSDAESNVVMYAYSHFDIDFVDSENPITNNGTILLKYKSYYDHPILAWVVNDGSFPSRNEIINANTVELNWEQSIVELKGVANKGDHLWIWATSENNDIASDCFVWEKTVFHGRLDAAATSETEGDFSVPEGPFAEGVEISFERKPRVSIRYTTDGSEPLSFAFPLTSSEQTRAASTTKDLDVEPLVFTAPMTVKFIAKIPGKKESEVQTFSVNTSGTTDITIVPEPQNGAFEYFDLQGRRMQCRPSHPGVYIERSGDTARKVVIR